MSFPLMPLSRPALFKKGALTLRQTMTATPASLSVTVGEPSEDRWVVFCATRTSGSAIAAWITPPTLNGVSMTQVVQDGATGGSDGQRGAIWVAKLTTGTTAVLDFGGTVIGLGVVFTMTGVRNPASAFITAVGSPGTTITNSVPSCAIYYACDNFGSLTAVTNMVFGASGGAGYVWVDYDTTTAATTYTVTGTSLYLNRYVSWAFDY